MLSRLKRRERSASMESCRFLLPPFPPYSIRFSPFTLRPFPVQSPLPKASWDYCTERCEVFQWVRSQPDWQTVSAAFRVENHAPDRGNSAIVDCRSFPLIRQPHKSHGWRLWQGRVQKVWLGGEWRRRVPRRRRRVGSSVRREIPPSHWGMGLGNSPEFFFDFVC